MGVDMNKKFLISWVVIFVVWMIGSFIVHGVLLGADYANANPGMMRPPAEQEGLFHWMLIAHVIMAGAFVWIYERGTENKDWMQQGIRFGIAIALLSVVPVYLIYYAVQPTAGIVVAKQIAFDGILVVILGIIVAFLNRAKSTAIQ